MFAAELAADPTASPAEVARRVGYAPGSASTTAARLLQRPDIVEAVAAARAEAVVSIASYWTLEALPATNPSGRSPGSALRLKRADELSAAEYAALAAESFDADGQLVRIVLVEPLPAVVELGRLAGLPGFDEEPADPPASDEDDERTVSDPPRSRRRPPAARPASERCSEAAGSDGTSVDGSWSYRDPFGA